jgi:hypothetical protein
MKRWLIIVGVFLFFGSTMGCSYHYKAYGKYADAKVAQTNALSNVQVARIQLETEKIRARRDIITAYMSANLNKKDGGIYTYEDQVTGRFHLVINNPDNAMAREIVEYIAMVGGEGDFRLSIPDIEAPEVDPYTKMTGEIAGKAANVGMMLIGGHYLKDIVKGLAEAKGDTTTTATNTTTTTDDHRTITTVSDAFKIDKHDDNSTAITDAFKDQSDHSQTDNSDHSDNSNNSDNSITRPEVVQPVVVTNPVLSEPTAGAP